MSVTDIPQWRRHLTLALLTVVNALNLLDRQIFSIFMPQIGEDLAINHQQLGFIAGLSYSVFYVLAAFPIARIADRGDRPKVIAACVAVWSLATAGCALAGSMLHLLLIRIGLAAGEGGAGPAAQSLVLQLYPPERRTIVLGLLIASAAVGLGAGGAIGGWLSQWFDWRQSLILVGVPGLLIALVVWLLAAEPRRSAAGRLEDVAPVPLRDVVGTLVRSWPLRWSALTLVLVSCAGFPFMIWSGSFYQIVHGMSAAEAGAGLFLPVTGGLVLGNLLAGWLGDRLGRGRPVAYALFAAGSLLIALPLGIATAQVQSSSASLGLFLLFNTIVTMHYPPIQALAFAQVRVGERAMLGAAMSMITTLCGLGIGTWMVGALSTYFTARYGDLSLRYALTAVCVTLPFGAFCAFMAGRSARNADQTAAPAAST